MIEIALGHTIEADDGRWNVGFDVHHDLSVGQNVGLREVVLEEENDLEGSGLPYRQLDCPLHGMQLHLSDVSRRGVDEGVIGVALSEIIVGSVGFYCVCIVAAD